MYFSLYSVYPRNTGLNCSLSQTKEYQKNAPSKGKNKWLKLKDMTRPEVPLVKCICRVQQPSPLFNLRGFLLGLYKRVKGVP